VYCDVSDRPSSSFNARVLVFSFLASPALRADTLLPESWIQLRELVLSPSTSLPSPWAWCQKWVCSFVWAKQKGRVQCGGLWRGPELVYDSMLAFLERQEVGSALKWMGYRWLLWFWCGGVLMESAAVVRTLRLGPLCLLHRGKRDATGFLDRWIGGSRPALRSGL
jgi:hypothetical protein